jgi:Holliday junction resolvase-like predicted endonuclease
MNPRQQGDLGEVAAMHWLTRHGYTVFAPVNHSPDVDLIAMRGEELRRVQVKTCTRRRNNRWTVEVCTRGGNQSWNGIVKRFSAKRCDWLFVLVGDGRQWFIPASGIEAENGVALGGPKYAEFEVEPGYPISLPQGA